MQSYGVISIQQFTISNLRFPASVFQGIWDNIRRKKAANKDYGVQQNFSVSFYADFINEISQSSEISTVYYGEEMTQELCWDINDIPLMFTPVNSQDLLQNRRLIALLWYIDEITQTHQVIGQLNIPLNEFKFLGEKPMGKVMNLTNVNEIVAQANFEFKFEVKQSRGK